MKRAILLILAGAVLGGGVMWFAKRSASTPAAEKPAEEEAHPAGITRDAGGDVVVHMTAETQSKAGIAAANPAAAQLVPELKGYGRVQDPVPLAGLVSELATARAAFAASSNELARLKTLEGQGNASPRALQTAEAVAQRDQLAAQSAQDRLTLSWGRALVDRDDWPAFIQSLTSLETVLVRIDLSPADVLESAPAGARVVTLSGQSTEAEFLAAAPAVDPQVQGRGFFLLIRTNALRLRAGEAVTGYLRIPGTPLAGTIVPRQAVVRTEGKGWVYVANTNGASFTRKEIALDHPVEAGWFVTNSVAPADRVVVTGAQTLLSEESKASISAD